ncbi:uncharacterized protein EV420DRAFT_1485855 [Desarmillaria tabescens]|uniref:Uncharacterized protein n=1 Tax=Armillaria tabescens TaxID=1929756 RepID=A0AA39MNX7_ARMTA|nr:uncharacterized protein EV420DRAFT_1485855 [Desarmillaria tabescens]KAK0440898.1 hypothetical protein EV420DRAFT_1485855 [Desarmillaria tabescens]
MQQKYEFVSQIDFSVASGTILHCPDVAHSSTTKGARLGEITNSGIASHRDNIWHILDNQGGPASALTFSIPLGPPHTHIIHTPPPPKPWEKSAPEDRNMGGICTVRRERKFYSATSQDAPPRPTCTMLLTHRRVDQAFPNTPPQTGREYIDTLFCTAKKRPQEPEYQPRKAVALPTHNINELFLSSQPTPPKPSEVEKGSVGGPGRPNRSGSLTEINSEAKPFTPPINRSGVGTQKYPALLSGEAMTGGGLSDMDSSKTEGARLRDVASES